MFEDEHSGRAVFAASTGGHLTQLHRLAQRFDASDDSLWITFDSPQSRSLLEGRPTLFVPYVAPRDLGGVVRAAARVAREVDPRDYAFAVSTGAALAVGVLPVLRARGVPGLYIESVSRFDGPSLTGRLLAASHLVELRTQHRSWADARWLPIEPVLREFAPAPAPATPSPRIFVTLGTIAPYRFDALVEAVSRTGLADSRTVWQTGCSDGHDLPGQQFPSVTSAQFERFATGADLVVTHGGVATVLQLLEWGISPVVVPRRSARREHVDDHQSEICRYLAETGLATVLDASDLTAEALRAATGRRVVAATSGQLS